MYPIHLLQRVICAIARDLPYGAMSLSGLPQWLLLPCKLVHTTLLSAKPTHQSSVILIRPPWTGRQGIKFLHGRKPGTRKVSPRHPAPFLHAWRPPPWIQPWSGITGHALKAAPGTRHQALVTSYQSLGPCTRHQSPEPRTRHQSPGKTWHRQAPCTSISRKKRKL